MANKTQKRQAERHKKEVQAQQQMLENLDQNQVNQLENYATFQILYVNDAAYNCCKFLGKELETTPYKTKNVRKVYGALMKRWAAYQEFVASTGIDQNSVATLFSEMDEYMDDRITKLQKAIQEVLERENVPHGHWIASCETAMTVCDYATEISKSIIERLVKVSKRVTWLIPLIVAEPARVMASMADMVQQIHVRAEIDLNNEEKVQIAFRQLNKAFCDPHNFKRAQTTADEENAAEGRMTIM